MSEKKDNSVVTKYDFEPIVEAFFHGGFSRITASYVKELLFNIYYEVHGEDGEATDFDIAQALGLTPAQVRTLRFKYDQTHKLNLTLRDILVGNPTECSDEGKWILISIDKLYLGEWAKNYLKTEFDIYSEFTLSRETLRVSLTDYATLIDAMCQTDQKIAKKTEERLNALAKTNPELKAALKSNGKASFFSRVKDPKTLQAVLECGLTFESILSQVFPILMR